MNKERHILSIDLKSFFASCECVMRHLDPFTTPLVVANKKQGNGAITLAVTPYLKSKEIPSRGRLYEIPKHIPYIVVQPRMQAYIAFSEKVLSIYLDFVSKEDLHVYSIDECFLDITSYLNLYKKEDYALAEDILLKIKEETGLTATCGIGPNILLAKVAMDLEAKHNKNGIAKWTQEDIKTKLWSISPLSKMWGIGPRMERNLATLGIFSIGDLAKYNKSILKEKYGILGEELWEHANGIDSSLIQEYNEQPKEKSYSNSQVLFKDYDGNSVQIIIKEMVLVVCKRLRLANKQSSCIGLAIGYSKSVGGGFYHTIKLDTSTEDEEVILKYCMLLFDRYYNGKPIRKVGVCAGRLCDKKMRQLTLFEDIEQVQKKEKKNIVVDKITSKFGKNSLLVASSLLQDSTIKERNTKIGGHQA